MYHSDGLEEVLDNGVYGKWGIDLASAVGWDFKRGISKGDVIFVVKAKDIEVGDVIIFTPKGSSSPYPIIHRVVTAGENSYSTKGDHNPNQLVPGNNGHRTDETNISDEDIIGKALFKFPIVGWAKLIFFEFNRPLNNRGLC
jgi:signal peptidase I